MGLSRASKIIALYCLTSPNIKLIRAYRLTDREIIFDTGVTQVELNSSKKELLSLDISFSSGYCLLNTPYAVFNYKGKHLQKAIANQLSEIPNKVKQILKSNTLCISHTYPIDRVGDNDNDNEDENKGGSRGEGESVKNIYNLYKLKINSSSRLLEKSKEKILTRLKSYKEEELTQAIENFAASEWWMENNNGRGVTWFFHSDDRIDQFLNLKAIKQAEIKSLY